MYPFRHLLAEPSCWDAAVENRFERPRMIPRGDVPIIINSFNRLSCLALLVDWLRAAGQHNIIIVDNGSTYGPLIKYLNKLEASADAKVIRLGDNFGHLCLWQQNLLSILHIDTEFIYTDPDILPVPDCPFDVVAVLQSLLCDEPLIEKAGLGIRINGIPECYRHKARAVEWERQFWLRPAAPGFFIASIDTTFALYRPHAGRGLGDRTIRTCWPYLASHLGYTVDDGSPSPEDLFYRKTARRDSSSWALPELEPKIAEALHNFPPTQPTLLRIGSGGAAWPGYRNCALADLSFINDASVDAIHVDVPWNEMRADRAACAELQRVARSGALMSLRMPKKYLRDIRSPGLFGSISPAQRRRRRGIGTNWRVELLTFAESTREALIHLRKRNPQIPRPAPERIHQKSRLDFRIDFRNVNLTAI